MSYSLGTWLGFVKYIITFLKTREAERTREDGARILTAPKSLVGDVSLELVPVRGYSPEADKSSARHHVVATLEEPNVISVDASEHRAHAATKAGVLSAALDASVSVGARNSLEKMIAHQTTAAHHAGMELIGRLAEDGMVSPRLPPVELARLTNAAARLFGSPSRMISRTNVNGFWYTGTRSSSATK